MDALVERLGEVHTTEEQQALLIEYNRRQSPEVTAHIVARHILFDLQDPSDVQRETAVAMLVYCGRTNINAVIELAQCFLFGFGVERDIQTAIDLYSYAHNTLQYADAESELIEDLVALLGNGEDSPVGELVYASEGS